MREIYLVETWQVAPNEPKEVVRRCEVYPSKREPTKRLRKYGDGGGNTPVKRSAWQEVRTACAANAKRAELLKGYGRHKSGEKMLPGASLSCRIHLNQQFVYELDEGCKPRTAWAHHQTSESHCAFLRPDEDRTSFIPEPTASLRPVETHKGPVQRVKHSLLAAIPVAFGATSIVAVIEGENRGEDVLRQGGCQPSGSADACG